MVEGAKLDGDRHVIPVGGACKVRLDRKAFYALREDTDVRAIRLVGFKDKRQAHWPLASPGRMPRTTTAGSSAAPPASPAC